MKTILASPTDVTRQLRRDDRYTARHALWGFSHNERRRNCGRGIRDAAGVTVVVSTDSAGARHAGFSGVESCGNVWACPVCASTVADRRQQEIEAALTEWVARGGRVVLGTVTLRHYARHTLTEVWDGLTAAKHAMLSGRGWSAEQLLYGVPMEREIKTGSRAGQVVMTLRVPVISVVEVTHGVNGWHVHLHMLLLLRGDIGRATVTELGAGLFARWSDALVSAGLPAPSFKHGQDFRLLQGDPAKALGEYFTKSTYTQGEGSVIRKGSMEVARGDLKDGTYGNRTPFGILRGIVFARSLAELGEVEVPSIDRDLALWHEWERVSAGRRQIAWSVGLRAWLASVETVEATAQEIVDEPAVIAADDEVHPLSGLIWRAVVRARGACALLVAFERSAYDGWLAVEAREDEGLEYEGGKPLPGSGRKSSRVVAGRISRAA